MARSLTAANAVIMLGITDLFDNPQQLQGFASDDVFDAPAVEQVEVQMGVDGLQSSGWIAVSVKWGVTLQANSASHDIFEAWTLAQNSAQEIYEAFGLVTLKSTGRKYTMNKGVLSSYPPMPSAGKILKPRKYEITWESIIPAAI